MEHLESHDVAAYLDGGLTPSGRARVEAHAATCDTCCAELVEAAALLGTTSQAPRWYVAAGAAAALAAGLALLVWSSPMARRAGEDRYREPAVTTAVAPTPVTTRGPTSDAMLVWTAVPRADRYRLTLFDRTGAVVWQTQTTDTSAAIPDDVHLTPSTRYLWKVEAQTGWHRWVSSDLVEFSTGSPRP